jgi:DNA-binding response OmpR family regulator
MQIGELVIDFDLRDVLVAGQPADLTNTEFELVAYLAKHLGKPIARDHLFEKVWGYQLDFNSNSLDVYVYRIRKRIEQDPSKPKYLHTMRGFGYKFVCPTE